MHMIGERSSKLFRSKKAMTWCSSPEHKRDDDVLQDQTPREATSPPPPPPPLPPPPPTPPLISIRTCPSCGHEIKFKDHEGGRINELPGLPAGVKFDPTDQELLEHLEGKVRSDLRKLHRLIDEFIPTLEGENGICYTHPEKLPGVSKNGQIRHFFHRPSKAYTTGNRKRRKVHTDIDNRTTASPSGTAAGETRWHKTGKTRPVFIKGDLKGFKKILVLYTNYGKQRKPEKTNWVMHQYHLGSNEEEKDGELVVSKVFYQTQPRQCGNNNNTTNNNNNPIGLSIDNNAAKTPGLAKFFNSSSSFISYDQANSKQQSRVLPHFGVHHQDGSSLLPN